LTTGCAQSQAYNLALRPNRNYWLSLSSLERNDELGIEAHLEPHSPESA
jgi:hypothetical protein